MDTTNSSEKPQRRVKHGQRPTEPLADWPAEFGAAGAEQPAATSGDAPADLQQLKALALAATPGKWMRLFGERTVYDRMEDGCRGNTIVRADTSYGAKDAANLDYIAAASPAVVLGLIARIESAAAPATASGDELESFGNYFAGTLSCDDSENADLISACRSAAHDAWMERARRAAVSAATKPTTEREMQLHAVAHTAAMEMVRIHNALGLPADEIVDAERIIAHIAATKPTADLSSFDADHFKQLLRDVSNESYFCGINLDNDEAYAGHLALAEAADKAIIDYVQSLLATKPAGVPEGAGKAEASRAGRQYQRKVDEKIIARRDAEIARLSAGQAGQVAKLPCPQCGVDRLKAPCPGLAGECAMIADAHLIESPTERAAAPASTGRDALSYGPVHVVADLVRNLLTLDQSAPIYSAFHVDHQGQRRCRTRGVMTSWERVIDGKWVDPARTDVPYAVIVWAKPEQDEAAPVAARELDVEAERRELDAEMDAAWQAYRKGRLRPLADAVLFCAGFRAARSAAQGTAPAPADESLSSDEIEALRAALSWMGESTYETLEECGIYQRSLLRRLIHAVVANRDATFAAQSTQPESAQVSTEQAGRRRQGTEMNRASPSQQRKAIEIANLFVKMGVGFVPVPVASAEEFEQLATQSIEKMSQLADALDDSPVGGKD